jgi:hypothetical protein
MLIDFMVAAGVVLAAGTIVALCLTYTVVLPATGLAVLDIAMSELLATRMLMGLVLALLFALAVAVVARAAILSIAATDWGPDIARRLFAPLAGGAAGACFAGLIHYARYRAPLTWGIAALYAGFGAPKLIFGNGWFPL